MKLLETSAEPEVLMAGMSSNQLASFASYKAKLEAKRQSEIQTSIEKAVEVAGLGHSSLLVHQPQYQVWEKFLFPVNSTLQLSWSMWERCTHTAIRKSSGCSSQMDPQLKFTRLDHQMHY
ncbi:hypothetical protein ACS0TY_025810 [Phlomoides rotata]